MRFFLHSILLLILSNNTLSQDINKARLDSLFSMLEMKQKVMGSVAIFKDGNEVYHNSIGYADVDKGLKANQDTKYRIGSISKTFTSAIMMQLIEEGKLSLDSKLSQFFPEIPNSNEITIEHLLRHRSGLYNFTNSSKYPSWMESPKSQSELIDLFIENDAMFEPDEKFEYSNTNYVLLSFIIEDMEGISYASVLLDRITKPLNLINTYYGGTIESGNNEAYSYYMEDEWKLGTETDMSIPIGAGGIVSTPYELNKFFNALFAGKVVCKSSLTEMTKLVDGYGLGLFQLPFYEHKAFGHNGGIDGFQSNTAYFTEDGVSVALTTNGLAMGMNEILIGILSIYFGRDYEFPTFEPGITLVSEDLEKYLGIYSSEELPIKITITKNGDQLYAQATGQSAFPLEAFEIHKFKFDRAGIKMEFLPEEGRMILIQGKRYEYSLEE